MIPGYNGGHPDLINGPSNHIPGYGPSGMSNRIPNYPGSYGSGMDSISMGQFGGGYGMHPIDVAPGMSTSGTITSSADAGYHPERLRPPSLTAEAGDPVGNRMNTSVVF